MCTIYFSSRDYREAMRNPFNPARCHAVCRRLLGCASQDGRWYGAHYYAACGLLSREGDRTEFWRRSFARECVGCDGRDNPPMSAANRALWQLAVKRVRALLPEAIGLPHSMLW